MTSPQNGRHIPGSPVCQTCNKTHPWPDGTTPRHPFNAGDLPVSATFGPKKQQVPGKGEPAEVRQVQWPFDPVLRQALIDKGILTPDDLRNAEEKIRAVTAQWEARGNDTVTGAASRP